MSDPTPPARTPTAVPSSVPSRSPDPDRVRRTRRGFSLIEVVLLIAILGVVAAIAMPRLAASQQRYRVALAADATQRFLEHAAAAARARSGGVIVRVSAANDALAAPDLPHPDRPSAPFRLDLADAPWRTNLSAGSLPIDTDITFDRDGRPDAGGTLAIDSGGHSITLELVQASGRVVRP